MQLNGVEIRDSFAEAFPMAGTRLVITADHLRWAMTAARSLTGFATSVIACGCEAGIERELGTEETPDGRPGVAILMFGMAEQALTQQLQTRVGQCVLTCATAAAYNGLDSDRRLKLGRALRFFGDGFQSSKRLGDRRYWRVPVMDGEFVVEEETGVTTEAVGGGNMLIVGNDRAGLLETTEAAVEAIGKVDDVITPFPGGIVRSGSKVGAKYSGMFASTNDAFCPTLRGTVKSELGPDTLAVLEIVIDGLTSKAVADAMRAGLKAVTETGAKRGVTRVTAGNYGGKLGQHHYHLKDLI